MSGESIYRQVLRAEFDGLAPELRSFHDVRGTARFHGKCRIESAAGPAGRFLRWLLGLPEAADDAELVFELEATPAGETWRRNFPGRTLRTRLRAAGGLLVEHVGPVALSFTLKVESGKLVMTLTRVSVLGLPWPRVLAPQVWGEARGSEGLLHFDAGARLPVLGLLTAYRGYLAVNQR